MKHTYDDTFLARWANNELTPEELLEFESSKDFVVYDKILKASSNLSVPEFNNEQLLKDLKVKLSSKKKSRLINLKVVYGAVASIAILLGIFYFTSFSLTKYNTGFGEQLAISLPDDSEVLLNAKSAISFNSNDWDNDRTVNLDGEAYFKVNKGKKFTVISDQGSVEVLGTQFNVNSNSTYFEVKCFEGKVKVTSNSKEVILTKGMGFRIINNSVSENISFDFSSKNTWVNGESSFVSTPLNEVVKSIEKQYNIKIINNTKIDLSRRFTGSFTHNNLQVALQSVFVPMEIDVIFTKEKTISLVKK